MLVWTRWCAFRAWQRCHPLHALVPVDVFPRHAAGVKTLPGSASQEAAAFAMTAKAHAVLLARHLAQVAWPAVSRGGDHEKLGGAWLQRGVHVAESAFATMAASSFRHPDRTALVR